MLARALGFVFAAGVVGVLGAPNPTEPSGSSVFNVGAQCTIKWDADATGTWKNMNIQLMTGDNWNMIHITTIAQDIDATDATKNTYSYTCPDVTPNSLIYFYQFSDASDPKNLLWTTRWTLASADGQTTPPSESTQPNGDKIGWGKGALVDPSTAVPPPAYLTNNQSNGSTNSTSRAATSGAATTSVVVTAQPTSPVVVTAITSVAPAPAAGTSTPAGARPATTGSATGASSSTNTTSSASTANGASTNVVSGFAMLGAFAAALGLF
ncbi:unnamed protein product [Rhizoctonia solani]|uniref:Yeast cell wall synthesis Kre9/Knh1-like N-terminal domain-containing protein n=1 Tax=Rhizoctonia solani TaxID=456999 RepID=A0A8H3E613_9AGAM|nr:unnamed protein product [Rhizoctonia solani]